MFRKLTGEAGRINTVERSGTSRGGLGMAMPHRWRHPPGGELTPWSHTKLSVSEIGYLCPPVDQSLGAGGCPGEGTE